ncbi:Frigida domain-containing protein [Cephalotus follicularis]|uniref:FRIGIDA-like protein n=1 Tax=Cephalotus follicularis TaxID=3775 RepID=A0A1Q3CRJ6_CEPFO|nr:Frigida domain-containing protein [Cephalotus follicularis]
MAIKHKIQGLDHDTRLNMKALEFGGLLRSSISLALAECMDSVKFVLEEILEVLPVDKRGSKVNDLCWACVLILESLIPVVVDSIICRSRLLVTPRVKVEAKEIAEAWKRRVCSVCN